MFLFKIINVMKKEPVNFPRQMAILKSLGQNIKMARLRRGFTMELICERADVSRTTLWQIENGSPNVAIGHYVNVLHAIGGFEKDLLSVASDDALGRTIQDYNLIVHKRGRK